MADVVGQYFEAPCHCPLCRSLGGRSRLDSSARGQIQLSGMEVLIVEDSEDTLTLLSAIFGKEGATVTTASSADEALNSVCEKRPNLILSDIGMPDTDGYTFLQQLKVLPGMDEVPAIAISGYASEEDRERALGVGYLALVPKPIDIDGLFKVILHVLSPASATNN